MTITGNRNSAEDNPSQLILRAFPLDFSKYLEIAVVAVWLISPWPENLIKKIPKTKKNKLLINEKNIEDKNKILITKNEYLNSEYSSIFFPTQINSMLEQIVENA